MTGFSETRRQMIHMTMGSFALLLRVMTWWQAALLAAAAVLFNLFALPYLGGRRLYRPADESRGFPVGILLYPLMVLLLILILPRRLDIVAIAWGIMAVGDGSATLIGRRFGTRRLPWNRDKSIAGTASLAVTGAAAGMFLAWWSAPAVVPPPPLTFIIVAPVLAAIAAAAVESIPVRLDDNIAVPGTAAAVLWACSLVTASAATMARPTIEANLIPAAVVNILASYAGWKGGGVTPIGAVAGGLIGFTIFTFAGAGGWSLLFVSFLIASITSRMGLKRKTVLGIAEERGGRRGAGNAIANCGVAVVAAILALLSPYPDLALLAFVAALTAGASDTVASEIGKAWGSHTFLVTGFRPVQPGTSGAVSLEGTAAGFIAAFALAALALAMGLMQASMLWIVVVAATVGAFVESALGATLEKRGILNNDMLNFINTLVAAVVAVALASAVQ